MLTPVPPSAAQVVSDPRAAERHRQAREAAARDPQRWGFVRPQPVSTLAGPAAPLPPTAPPHPAAPRTESTSHTHPAQRAAWHKKAKR